MLQFAGDQGEHIQELRKVMKPLQLTLDKHPYLGGKEPALTDLLLFAHIRVGPACCWYSAPARLST